MQGHSSPWNGSALKLGHAVQGRVSLGMGAAETDSLLLPGTLPGTLPGASRAKDNGVEAPLLAMPWPDGAHLLM